MAIVEFCPTLTVGFMALSATPHDEMKGAMLFRILKFKINLGTTGNFAILPQIFYNNDVRNQILHIKLSTFVLINWKPGEYLATRKVQNYRSSTRGQLINLKILSNKIVYTLHST